MLLAGVIKVWEVGAWGYSATFATSTYSCKTTSRPWHSEMHNHTGPNSRISFSLVGHTPSVEDGTHNTNAQTKGIPNLKYPWYGFGPTIATESSLMVAWSTVRYNISIYSVLLSISYRRWPKSLKYQYHMFCQHPEYCSFISNVVC